MNAPDIILWSSTVLSLINCCRTMLPLLMFVISTLGCVSATATSLELHLYSCSGDPATVTCVAEQVPHLQWEIRDGVSVIGSSEQPTEGNKTIAGVFQVTSISTLNTDNPSLLDIQSTLTFSPAQVPENVRFQCSAMQGGLSSMSQITPSLTSDALHMNYTVVEYKQDVVVTSVTWEPSIEGTLYSIKAIPGSTGDAIIQQLNSPPAHFSLSYNTDYNLTVQDTQCRESVSTRFFQSGCSTPVPPENGQLDRFASSHVGAEITYQCLSGTSVNATCSEDLQWVPPPSEVSCMESNLGNCGAMNAGDNVQVLNNTDPDNVLLRCVDGFEPEEVILVQCINGTWHPDPATLNCTEKSPPIKDSENNDGNISVLIIIAVASVVLLLFVLLSVMLLLACLRKQARKIKHHQRKKGLGKVGAGQEPSSDQQRPQDHDVVGNYQLQQNEAYGTNINYIPGRHNMAMMMTINAAYGSVARNGQSDVVLCGENMAHSGSNTAPELDEEDEEYHYYY